MTVDWLTIGPCRIACGDCLDILGTLPPVDAVVTDPPYGLDIGRTNNQFDDSTHLKKKSYLSYDDTYANFVTDIVPRLNAAIDKCKAACVFSGPHIHEQRKPVAIGGVFCPCATGRTPWGSKNFLPLLLYGNPRTKPGCHRPTVLTSTTAAEPSEHPCPKPLEWMNWTVEFASLEADTVLDPFMGSGTTGVACIRLARKFIGIEKEERYFEIARKRLEREWQLKKSELPYNPAPCVAARRTVIISLPG